jgi:F0F1-type ATP synthase membrane subunit c/vacuolar-type H+-ATPase subunit K
VGRPRHAPSLEYEQQSTFNLECPSDQKRRIEMNKRLVFTSLVALGAVLLIGLAVFYQSAAQGTSAGNAAGSEASVPSAGVSARIQYLTKAHRAPDAVSEVVSVFTPSQKALELSGRSADGAWLAIEDGWVAASEVEVQGNIQDLPALADAQASTGKTTVLTKVHRQADAQAEVGGILMAYETVYILDRNADGSMLAISTSADADVPQGWVQASEITMDK